MSNRQTPAIAGRAGVLAVVLAVGLGGCEMLPEWMNPMNWGASPTEGSFLETPSGYPVLAAIPADADRGSDAARVADASALATLRQ